MKEIKLFKAICKQCTTIPFQRKKIPRIMDEDEIAAMEGRVEVFLKNKRIDCPVKLALDFLNFSEAAKTKILDTLNKRFPECSFYVDAATLKKHREKQKINPVYTQTQIRF